MIKKAEVASRNTLQCRFCGAKLRNAIVDLGTSPLANSYLSPVELNRMEPFFPLRLYLCRECFLFQLEEFESPEDLFSDYAYFSSYSSTWLEHARAYTEMMVERFGFNERSQVVELASNDGYLLQYFVAKGIPVLGIEPAANVAEVAIQKGIPTVPHFFGEEEACRLVTQGTRADLIVGNNVFAHVPKVNDFTKGMKLLLKTGGVITLEFPHLMKLINENQFDTIYHEHFSYYSLRTAEAILAAHGLKVFDVEGISTHGGSLRVYACHAEDSSKPKSPRVDVLKGQEKLAGLTDLDRYSCFFEKVKETKRKLLGFLVKVKQEGKSVAAYGAPAKGNTLLNYCGIGTDIIDYTVDHSPHKQGLFLPGTHIPIHSPDKIRETQPDYLLILPWNLKSEIMAQMSDLRSWGGKFVIPIPELKVCS